MPGRVRFHVKGWLDEDDFRSLLEFSDYLGRDPEKGSIFEVNWVKARRNRLSPQAILEAIESAGGVLEASSRVLLESEVRRDRRVVLEWSGSTVVLRTRVYLGPYLDEIRGYVSYDRTSKVFRVVPMHFFDLKHKLGELGFEVEDRTGLQESQPLSFKVEFRGELRSYQSEALEALRSRGWRGIVALPTGSGKTVIAVAALAELGERTLIVTYTKEQMFQWVDMLTKFTNLRREHIGLYYGERKRLAPITVSTYQTAYRHIFRIAPLHTTLIIDECHHLPAERFRHIARNTFAPHRIGLSATVVREDGKHVELFPMLGGVVYHKHPGELSEQGFLAPYRIIEEKVELAPRERREYLSYLEAYRRFAMGRRFEQLLDLARRGDRYAQLALKAHAKMRMVVQMSESKLSKVREIVSKELRRGSKILVFTQYVEQAKKLAELLDAPLLIGELDVATRKRVLGDFKSGRSRVLVVTTVGDEGLDIPDANVGILVSGTGSRRQFVQRLGRLLRPGEGKEARLYEIVVKGTQEERQARRRKKLGLDELGF